MFNNCLILNLLFQISFNILNIRLSYIDMKMFLAILNSIPEQALKAQQHDKPADRNYPGITSSGTQGRCLALKM